MTAVVTVSGAEPLGHGHPAGIITRGLAAVLDIAAIFVLQLLVYVGIAAVRFLWEPDNFQVPDSGPFALLGSTAALTVVYLTVGWAISGRTYGDAVLGIRVIDASGHVPGWGRAFLRAVCCLMFPFGFLWVAVSSKRRSVQDLLLRTSVVYDWHRG